MPWHACSMWVIGFWKLSFFCYELCRRITKVLCELWWWKLRFVYFSYPYVHFSSIASEHIYTKAFLLYSIRLSHHLAWQFKARLLLRYFSFLPVASQSYDDLRIMITICWYLVQHAGMWWNRKGCRWYVIWKARSSPLQRERTSISWHSRKGIL